MKYFNFANLFNFGCNHFNFFVIYNQNNTVLCHFRAFIPIAQRFTDTHRHSPYSTVPSDAVSKQNNAKLCVMGDACNGVFFRCLQQGIFQVLVTGRFSGIFLCQELFSHFLFYSLIASPTLNDTHPTPPYPQTL